MNALSLDTSDSLFPLAREGPGWGVSLLLPEVHLHARSPLPSPPPTLVGRGSKATP